MTKRDEGSFDFLTAREADFMKSVIDELADTSWAKPLVDDINATGGLTGDNKAKLFELRFGHTLHKAGILPRYETAGEGQSTLDYGFTSGGRDFLVEMMRLEETDAVSHYPRIFRSWLQPAYLPEIRKRRQATQVFGTRVRYTCASSRFPNVP